MKKFLAICLALVLVLAFTLTGCGETKQKSEVQKIIEQAQTMSLDELCRKAIEESNGKTFYGLGNSSRGKSALPLFIDYCKTLDSSYNMEYDWQQPKENKIFDQLTADGQKDVGTFAMTLIQDGNQIESKMVRTGVLDRFIPKDWAEANNTTAAKFDGYLALQTLNKVFEFNNVNGKSYDNMWDFVAKDEHGMFMGLNSEPVGKNFLMTLTKDEYANVAKEAYDALSADEKAYFDPIIESVSAKAKEFGLGANGKYALAWIKLWVENFNEQTDDGPICNELVKKSAAGQFGLLVYSKVRSVTETDESSVNNIRVAAYEDGYKGIGGYGYCHYLFVTDNSPLPWTACAFIAYMTCTVDGFSAWGKDIGGYSSNPKVVAGTDEKYPEHKTGVKDGVTYEVLKDRGFSWWENHLVIEDPVYCANVAFTIGDWIDSLRK